MTIPASDIVSVNPGVIGSGGSPLALNGVILTKNTLLPANNPRPFASADSVGAFFGLSSTEYTLAQVYFLGYDNSFIKPGNLFFAPYNDAARAAWLQSGSLASVSLTTLKTYTGVLTVTVDGTVKTSSTINLSSATSFSNAATLITAGFTGGSAPVCTWNAVNSTFVLTSPTTGASTSSITYATGTLATNLAFTSATGAILSPGADIDTPTTAMARVKAFTQNWFDFMTVWEPDTANKLLFAAWANSQNQRFAYIAWDTDVQATISGSTTAFGVQAKTLEYDAVFPVYNTPDVAAMVMGSVASIDFSRTNGRATLAFKSQAGLAATVTDQQIAANLLENGYNFYGIWATANDQFNFLYNGQITGRWKWLDTFAGEVYMNSQFQLALMTLLTTVGSIPYNEAGYSLVRAAMIDPISAGLNFGNIRAGIDLSSQQAAVVNQQAGRDVATTIEQQGYYLQVLDPGAQVRGNRGTPVINFWYTDGGSIQKMNVASTDIM